MTTWAEYVEIDAVNISRLLELAKSPQHYRAALQFTKRDTEALRFGRLAHRAILEPEAYQDEIAIWTGGVRRGKAWDEWLRETAGKVQVTQDDHELCMALEAAVRQHPVAGMYLSRPAMTEHTIKWTHGKTGIVAKSRLDWIDPADAIVIDLKTARDATEFEFARSAARLQYHARAAFYCDAYEAKFGGQPKYVLLVVEKEPPYAVACYRMPDDAIDAGRRVYEALLAQLKHCIETDSWPGICGDEERELVLPAWAPGMNDELDLVVGEERVSV